ncbi:MAG: cation:proton antiporter, partial [Gemmatimonadaceae bacterium]
MAHSVSIVVAIAVVALVVALSALARHLLVPTPILQVIAGFLVGMIPGVTLPDLDPALVFFVFLPPIIWSAAMFTSVRDFRRNFGSIGALAVGLVLVTTAAVAIVARLLFPGLPWAAAVALGAIVS